MGLLMDRGLRILGPINHLSLRGNPPACKEPWEDPINPKSDGSLLDVMKPVLYQVGRIPVVAESSRRTAEI
jgi:hypothetical protein